jgi:hypothetical protein
MCNDLPSCFGIRDSLSIQQVLEVWIFDGDVEIQEGAGLCVKRMQMTSIWTPCEATDVACNFIASQRMKSGDGDREERAAGPCAGGAVDEVWAPNAVG